MVWILIRLTPSLRVEPAGLTGEGRDAKDFFTNWPLAGYQNVPGSVLSYAQLGLNATKAVDYQDEGESRLMPTPDLKTKSLDEQMAYVIKHPYRVDALAILNERVASIAEIAGIMDVVVSKLEHHVKALFDAGCIEIVRSEPRRGAHEHYYCASLRPNISDEAWKVLSQEERLEISRLVFGAIMAEGVGAIRAHSFDSRKDRHLSWRILHLDEEGWLELAEEKAESLERTEAIQANAYRRMAESGEEGISVIAGAFAFERAIPGRSEGHGPID